MNLKSKSKMFKALVEKMDIALSTDLCTQLAKNELENR